MAQELVVAPAGLWTDPSTLQAPQGALSDARNVVINRPGLVEPRPGLPVVRALTGDWAPNGLKVGVGGVLSFERDGFTNNWRAVPLATGSSVDTNAPPDSTRTSHMLVNARGSSYWTSAVGIRKLESPSGSSTTSAGAVAPVLLATFVVTSSAWAAEWLPNNECVAYRFVLLRKDVNGYEIRSEPSARFVATNTSGATAYVAISFSRSSLLRSTDVIEVYRSTAVPVGTEPNDELYLVGTYPASASLITAFIDQCPDALTREAIYTAPSQNGLDFAKLDPPLAWDVASFGGCVFSLNTTRRRKITMFLKTAGFFGSSVDASFFGVRGTSSATATNGSDMLTGFANTDAVEIGQCVVDDQVGSYPGPLGVSVGGAVPVNARVIAKTGTTVQMSLPATATSVGFFPRFCDVLNVGGVEFYATNQTTDYTLRCYQVDTTGLNNPSYALANLSYVINAWSVSNALTIRSVLTDAPRENIAPPAAPSFSTIQIEDQSATYTSTYVYSTKGSQWGPVGLPSSSSGNTRFEAANAPNELVWSEPNEPESVPAPNSVLLGEKTSRGLRLVPLRDCLLIFKEDGLWRLTGAYNTFTIDPVDTTLRLLRPEAVDVLDDVAYAITNQGVVAVGPDGVRAVVSDPIDASTRARLATFTEVLWVVCQDADKQVICGGLVASDSAYVYSARTGGWSYWNDVGSWRCGVFDESSNVGTLYVGTSISGSVIISGVRRQLRNYTVFDYGDGDTVYNVTFVAQSAEQDALGNLWDLTIAGARPANGDYVIGPGTDLVVVAQLGGGVQGRLFNAAFPPTIGTYTGSRSYQCTVQFVGKTAQNPGLLKTWREMSFGFQFAQSLERVTLSEFGDIDTTAGSATQVLNPPATSTTTRQVRHGIAQTGIQAVYTTPTIAWKQSVCKPLISSLSLIYEPVSENVRSR